MRNRFKGRQTGVAGDGFRAGRRRHRGGRLPGRNNSLPWCAFSQYYGEILQLRADCKTLNDSKDKYKAMVLRLEDKLLHAEQKIVALQSA